MKKERKEFESRFDTKEKEVLVLTQSNASSGKNGNAILWDANMSLLAYMDMKTGKVITGKTRLTWQLTDEVCRTKEKIFNLQQEQMYQLIVRESLPVSSSSEKENSCRIKYLMVVDVVKRDCENSYLKEILAEYQKPVTISPRGCSELLLDKHLEMFDGNCIWNGESCGLHLDVDEEGAKTADEAVAVLEILLSQSEIWDNKARKYAAAELTDLAKDWQTEEEDEEGETSKAAELTEEIFADRIIFSELCISTGGDFELYYDDDDMFWGHVIIVRGNIEKGFDDAEIAG